MQGANQEAMQAEGATDRSMALRLSLNSDEASLTEEQIEAVVKSILDQLTASLGARLRA